MSRDYTKYTVEGLGESLNKRKLVFTIVKDYVEKNNPSFEELQNSFPDEIQGSKGFIRKESDVKTPKHFNMREPLKIKNGAHVVVSNQWGKNIEAFITTAQNLGYNVSKSFKKVELDEKIIENLVVNQVKIIIRNSENSKNIDECDYFNLNISDLQLSFETPFTFEQYDNLVKSILDNETKISEIKSIVSRYSITYDWLPQFWVVAFDDFDLEPLYKLHFDYDEAQVPLILESFPGIDESDIEDYMDDFVLDCVFSVEGFGEDGDW